MAVKVKLPVLLESLDFQMLGWYLVGLEDDDEPDVLILNKEED